MENSSSLCATLKIWSDHDSAASSSYQKWTTLSCHNIKPEEKLIDCLLVNFITITAQIVRRNFQCKTRILMSSGLEAAEKPRSPQVELSAYR
ncbi:hypothetical protein PGT21_036743 [Puccinia graminis f. sp. tritici]|uniref:Uncharacterized protein n=2 Tax=Puccinia graminis f. sp. tritici TaxID=56615 RepID=E3L3B3_PUCGT|nr:uncharacterized protein PGTG_17310 [Puccinia graminis f. sp. tritici CRL 75-36-700-3]EFP91038.2 hypothetical protein PGTG_17310 [Puccinia graminis f. sp. tritici CRL 75-36-700-3]KAA1119986.1 hypothetical protein PGT21_036743 [Puccinia graminis f. sp. tritici]